MKIIYVKGNTYCIETNLSIIPFYKINETDIILLDSGWFEEREGIVDLLKKNHLTVKAIINSHAHVDHIGNNAYFKELNQCLIAIPTLEAYVCSSKTNLKVYYNNLTLTDVDKHFGYLVHQADYLIGVNDQSIDILDIHFKVIHTPGHSPAHICIVTPDEVCYLGDTLISRDVMVSSKMPYAYILSEDLKSKAKLANLPYSKYVLAHKVILDDISTLVTENIEFYKNRALNIYEIIENNMSFEAILKKVLQEFRIIIRNINKYVVIERMLRSYVDYLIEIDLLKIEISEGIVKYIK